MSEPAIEGASPSPPNQRPSQLPVVVVALLLSVVAGAAGWWLGGRSVELDARGQPAILTTFSYPNLEGQSLGPGDFEGSVLIVDFWATWCTPCRYQTRILEDLLEHYTEEGADVRLLAVSVGESLQTVREHQEKEPVHYPSVVDVKGQMMSEGDVHLLPTVMVIGRSGEIEFLRPGVSSHDKLRRVVDEGSRELRSPTGPHESLRG